MNSKPWKKMSAAEKRVAIAYDVIAAARKPNIKVTKGKYFVETNGPKNNFGCTIADKNKCEVCAKGGLMLAFMGRTGKKFNKEIDPESEGFYIHKVNGKFQRIMNDAIITDALSDIFGDALTLIEHCFEGWTDRCSKGGFDEFYNWDHSKWTPMNPAEIIPFKRIRDSRKRLIGIMGNIIANNGDFVASEGPIFTVKVEVAL